MSDARRFIVWNVFGNAGGNVALLAVYPFPKRADADAHAARVKGGYVLRADAERQLRNVKTHATGDTRPASVPASDADMRAAILATPCVSLPVPVNVWTVHENPHGPPDVSEPKTYEDGGFGMKVAREMALAWVKQSGGSLTITDANGMTIAYHVRYGMRGECMYTVRVALVSAGRRFSTFATG